MTGKLIRFEFRSTARIMLGLYLALIALSLINRISSEIGLLENDTVGFSAVSGVLLMAMYVICAGATLLITMVMIVIRFWRNLLENQGYLMHTLPVRTRDHIISKLLAAFVWLFVSFLVFLISIGILTWHNEDVSNIRFEFVSTLDKLFSIQGGALCFILGIVIVIVSICAEILKLYTAMSMGQTLTEHRIAGSIGMYVAIGILESFFETALIMILGFTGQKFDIVNSEITNYLFPMDAAGEITSLYGAALSEAVYLIIPVLYCVIYFILTNYFLGKKLNLV